MDIQDLSTRLQELMDLLDTPIEDRRYIHADLVNAYTIRDEARDELLRMYVKNFEAELAHRQKGGSPNSLS